MKQLLISLMIICLLLSGCGTLTERMIEPVSFYYLEESYGYGQDSSVIVSEIRESSGHRNDLSYMLALYLMGPTEETHVSPLPAGTRIYVSESGDHEVCLTLSDAALTLSAEEFSLACACLTLTCLELQDTDQVTINCGENSLTMHAELLTLYDNSTVNTIKEDIN